MKATILNIALATSLGITGPVIAQMKGDSGDMKHGASDMAQSTAMTEGVIRKVNKDAGKLTIKHEEIKHLDMPPMTMVFQVKDPAMLDQVKEGDKVRFAVESKGGAMTVTKIEATK